MGWPGSVTERQMESTLDAGVVELPAACDFAKEARALERAHAHHAAVTQRRWHVRLASPRWRGHRSSIGCRPRRVRRLVRRDRSAQSGGDDPDDGPPHGLHPASDGLGRERRVGARNGDLGRRNKNTEEPTVIDPASVIGGGSRE